VVSKNVSLIASSFVHYLSNLLRAATFCLLPCVVPILFFFFFPLEKDLSTLRVLKSVLYRDLDVCRDFFEVAIDESF